MIRDTLTWAARAFAVTALVLLVVTMVGRPLFGRAQSEGAGTAPVAQADEAPPAGADDGAPRSNLEAMVPEAMAPSVSDVEESLLSAAGYDSPLVIPAADFSSDGADPDGFFFSFTGGYVDGSGTACLKAPAYLPSGAIVVAVWASLYNNTTGNVTVNLRRVNLVTGASDVMAAVSTESADTAIQQRETTVINYPEVIYPEYAYYVTTCLNSVDHRLYSVRIHYTEP